MTDITVGDTVHEVTVGETVYSVTLSGSGGGSDANAVHVNVASEISGVAVKNTPAAGDFFLIEDSEASNAKKHILFSSLPGAGSGEANTASNAGSGLSLFYQKSTYDLEFNGIKSLSGLMLDISLNAGTHDLEFTIDETNIDHDNLANTHNMTTDIATHADVAANTAARHAESHTVASHSDTTATGAELDELTDGSETTLHSHAGGSHGNHTGDVTSVGLATTIASGAVDLDMLSATGTPSGSNFLRGDNTWSVPAGSGDVSKVGTPVNNQVGVWTGDGTIEGDADLTFDGLNLSLTGNIVVGGTVDGIDIATDVAANTAASHTHSNQAVLDATTASFLTADETKLDGIEALAEVNNISDAHAILLTTGVNASIHYHDTDRSRANHSGTQLAATISDLTATITAHTDVAANTAARHAESHTVASHSDTTATGAELNELTDGSTTTLHSHSGTTDADAIHDNVAAEISAITEKGIPVSGDWILIEDSAATNAKKKVQIGNLPTGGGGEANTMSSQGSGTSLYYTKSGVELQLNAIKSENALLSIALDAVSHDVELTVNEGSFDHDNLTNTHDLTTDIDHNTITNYEAGQHRIINDAGTSATELWSASKISSDLATKGDGDTKAADNEAITGLWNFMASGVGGLTDYDATFGDVSTPDYGILRIGNSAWGRTNNTTGYNLNGATVIQNVGGPVTGDIEFAVLDSSDLMRFGLPKSGVGNATYNPRSMLIAGPAIADSDIVTVGYWQTQGIFHNLACDTGLSGADLGVQNDLEVEGDIFTDSIKESTAAAGVTIDGLLVKDSGIPEAAVTAHEAALSLTASQVSDFDTEVGNHADVAANTAARHDESHTIASHSDTTATGTELDTLTGGGETALHSHAADHTHSNKAQLDLVTDGDHDAITSGNPHSVTKTDVGLSAVLNNAQVRNMPSSFTTDFTQAADPPFTSMVLVEASGGTMRWATLNSLPINTETTTALAGKSDTGHSHVATDVTDFDTEVSNNTSVAANSAKVSNATHTGDVTGSTELTIANDAVDIAMLSATGTPSSSTFLRGDNTWSTTSGSGDVSGPASAVDNSVARFNGTTGKIIQSASASQNVLIDDSGNTEFPGNVTFDALVTVSGSGAQTVNFTNGNKAKLTLTGNITGLTLTFPGIGNYMLHISNASDYTLAWTTTVKWPGGTAPTTDDDCLVAFYYDGTTAWGTFSEAMA